jgi:hypothetical protein
MRDFVIRRRSDVHLPHPFDSKPRSDDLIVTSVGADSFSFAMIALSPPEKFRKRAQ